MRFDQIVHKGHIIVISAITYAEMRFGSIGKKASARLPLLVDEFVERVDAILPLDKKSVELATELRQTLSTGGQLIGINDSLIAGHALASSCILVTNNLDEFSRVPELRLENWTQ